MLSIPYLANMITITRIAGAAILPFPVPFSPLFWGLYLYCGISDIADGMVARALKQQSNFGAQFDSIADIIVFIAMVIVMIPALVIPAWIWICTLVIALIRVTAYGIGYHKYHTFSALHTYANKATGGVLFCVPILYITLGVTAMGVLLCLVAAYSACEELLITLQAKTLDRNRRSLFTR